MVLKIYAAMPAGNLTRLSEHVKAFRVEKYCEDIRGCCSDDALPIKEGENMSKIVDAISKLPELSSLKPATEIEIQDAETQLGVSFNEEYRDYLLTFGAISADGIELTGIAKEAYINVVNQTKQWREVNPDIPNTMYVIEDTGFYGSAIWQDKNGKVFMSELGSELKQVADSLTEYILNR